MQLVSQVLLPIYLFIIFSSFFWTNFLSTSFPTIQSSSLCFNRGSHPASSVHNLLLGKWHSTRMLMLEPRFSPKTRLNPGASVVKAWSPNHWITRKFPSYCSLGSKRHVSLSTAIPHLEEDLGTSLWNNTSTLEKTTFLKRKREKGVSVYIHVYIYAYTHVIYMYIK